MPYGFLCIFSWHGATNRTFPGVSDSFMTVDLEMMNGQLTTEVIQRKEAEKAQEKLISKLQNALSRIKALSGLLPICSACKKIRNDAGYWEQIEIYIRDHSEADFSHGICPECIERLYPEYKDK